MKILKYYSGVKEGMKFWSVLRGFRISGIERINEATGYGLPGKLLSNRCMCVLLRCYNVLAVMVITDSAKYFAFQFHIVHTFV